MHTIIHPTKPSHRTALDNSETFRNPHYDCASMDNDLKVVVYVPGVDASGVDIQQRGPDLVVTARKAHVVRTNWRALHLEGSQRDYRLRLRLGHHLDYDALNAEIVDGVLTIRIPRRVNSAARTRRVA